jgi:hypothetical protein
LRIFLLLIFPLSASVTGEMKEKGERESCLGEAAHSNNIQHALQHNGGGCRRVVAARILGGTRTKEEGETTAK